MAHCDRNSPNWLLTKCYECFAAISLKLDYMSSVQDWLISGDTSKHMQLQVLWSSTVDIRSSNAAEGGFTNRDNAHFNRDE